MNKTKALALCSSTALLAVGWAYSQDKSPNADYLNEFNVIGTKESSKTLQGSGTVLDSSDLDVFRHTNINEILRQVPGVYVRPEDGYGFFPNISMRGVNPSRSNKVTIMEDGVPSSPAPIADPAAYYSPTAGRMSGFEILKGSSSLKHGPNTTGGVINYLSTPIPSEQESYLRGTYGSFNEKIIHAYSGGKIDFAGGRLGYLLEVFDHSSDGWKNIGSINGEPEKNSPVSKSDFVFKLGYDFADGDYLEFKVGRMDMDADVSYQGLSKTDFDANPYSRYAGTEHDNMDADQTRYHLRYRSDLSDSLSLTSTLFLNQFNRNWYKLSKVKETTDAKDTKVGKGVHEDSDLVNVLKGNTSGSYHVKSNDRSYESKGAMLAFDYEVNNHNFDLGFRVMSDDYNKNAWHEDKYTVTAGADETNTSKEYIPQKGKDNYKDADSFEIYLTDDIDYGKLTVSPGVRYTTIDYKYDGANARSLDEVIFGIGGVYDWSESLTLFSGIHQGQTFPDAESASSDTEDGLRSQETSINFEFGVRGSSENIYYEIAYFNTQLKDMLFLESAAGGLENSYNLGEGSTQGLEFLIGSNFSDGLGFNIPVSASLTLTDTEFESGEGEAEAGSSVNGANQGNEFRYIPDTMINLRAGLEFERVSTYLNYHYQSSVFTDTGNSAKLGAYGVLDWSGSYKLSESAAIVGKVTNLTDEVYAHSILPDGYRAGAPRIASIGMEFDF